MTDSVPSKSRPGKMRWQVENSEDYVTVRTEGQFNVDDHRAMVRDVVSQPFWAPGRAAFFDHRALDFDGVGYDVMKSAVENHEAADDEIGAGRAAILMNSLANYGLGRIFDGVSSSRIQALVRIFTNEAEAREWLTSEVEPPR
jgi:hypothetical protein